MILGSDHHFACRDWQNGVAVLGAGGFGLSLFLIHIYVAPLKRFLQLLWAAGVIGGISIMATQVSIPRSTLLIGLCLGFSLGPQSAALSMKKAAQVGDGV